MCLAAFEDNGSDAPSDTQTITYERSKTCGRKVLPASLPRVEIELDIPESDKVCACRCKKNRTRSDSSKLIA